VFAAFVVFLRPTVAATIGNAVGKSLHGLFFNLITQKDPALAQQLHIPNQRQPFTVSTLRGRFRREGLRNGVSPDQVYSVRYTTLSDELFNALSQILLGKYLYRGTVTIDDVEFKVTDVTVEPDKSRGWGRLSAAEEIWEQAQASIDITLRFASPTTFRQRGLNLMFPLPANVFYSYREKWNAFTPFPIDDAFPAWVEQNVAVEAHELRTRMMWFSDFQLHGFTGWCRYTVKDRDPQRLKQLNALADFALFSGTGQKTTQGLGQTRRLSPRFDSQPDSEQEGQDGDNQ
jgi:CRISPR-associated endoribonuclease Cas6